MKPYLSVFLRLLCFRMNTSQCSSSRPRRKVAHLIDYKELSDVKIPKRKRQRVNSKKVETDTRNDTTLFRVNILETDEESGSVKVSYIGYSDEYNEWRPRDDIVDLTSDADNGKLVDESSGNTNHDFADLGETLVPIPSQQFCLYNELAFKIKSLLISNRKADPQCKIIMTFDKLCYDGLLYRGVPVKKHGCKEIYTVISLSKLDDILGERWYIRGINVAGDFSFVKPGSVRYFLKCCQGQKDYQIQSDGSLKMFNFGTRYQLTFSFIREDGTLPQWYTTLKLCQTVVRL